MRIINKHKEKNAQKKKCIKNVYICLYMFMCLYMYIHSLCMYTQRRSLSLGNPRLVACCSGA
jgi:hypothetical protein